MTNLLVSSRLPLLRAVAALSLTLAACAPAVEGADAASPAVATHAQALTGTAPLVITEVMANPAAAEDDVGEWFEIHNPGSEPVDLQEWTLASNNDAAHTVALSVVIPPGGYVVVGRSADASANGGVPVAYAYGASLTLANTSDWLSLIDPDGEVVDDVAWTAAAPVGASRALGNPACDNAEAHDIAWSTSTTPFGAGDRGTPAASNGAPAACPVFPPPPPRDVRITEVMADPNVIADTAGEWLELFNPGAADINLRGWRLRSRNDADHVIATDVVVPAGGYAVLGNNASTATNGGVTVAYAYPSTLALANGTDWVELRRPDAEGGALVESVSWGSGISAGASRALLKPDAANADDVGGSAWANSTLNYHPSNRGSPGRANPAPRGGMSVYVSDPARLPVGYEKPANYTVRDASGKTLYPRPAVTWSSSDEAVARVDASGAVTGVAPGTAFIRATTADGLSAAAFLTVVPATADTTAAYGDHLAFGVPQDADPSDDLLVTRAQYALSFSAARGGPNWVAYELNPTHFGTADRCNCFTPDPALPADAPRVADADYRGGGYDRGHMVPSFHRGATEQENATTYLTSNILPQAAENNQGPWARLETHLADLVRTQGKRVYVVTGGLYAPGAPTLKGAGKVAIPDYTWKVAAVVDAGEGLEDVRTLDDVQLIAVRMPNRVGPVGPASADGIRGAPWQAYETTVDALEAATGYDLLALLPDALERMLESKDRPPVAHVTGPAQADEGAAVTLDASGSTDPDGDALTYTWTFSDGTTAEGASVSHTFVDEGAYTATVTVTDPYGAQSSASTSVSVANVAPALAGALPAATLLPHELYVAVGAFTDPGADAWSATVDWGEGAGPEPLALTGQAFQLSHVFATPGRFAVSVTVDDGDGGAFTHAVGVTVLTHPQAIAGLAEHVGALELRQPQPLLAKLQAASALAAAGHVHTASLVLDAFAHQVDALVRSGRLAPVDAEELKAHAARIQASLVP